MSAFRASRPLRTPQEDAAADREGLLDAARALLSRDPSASLGAIAVEAGLSRRALHGHFADREALLEALTRRGTRRVVEAVSHVDHDDPRVLLALLAAAAWDQVEHVRALTSTTVRSPHAALLDDGLEPLRARLVATIDAGVARSLLRDDIPSDRLARLLIEVVVAVFGESTRAELDVDTGRELVVALTLSTVGLSAAESAELLAAHPQVTASRSRVDPLWPPTEAVRVVGDGDAGGGVPETAR